MTAFFLDSSALVKRYVEESGSEWVRGVFAEREHHTLIIAEITLVEVSSALSRRQRRGEMTEAMRQRYESLFFSDLEGCRTIPLEMATVKAAMGCCHRFGLKAYDAVQLATAVLVHTQLKTHGLPLLTFVSADRDLLEAAASPEYQFRTVDPNNL